LTNVLKKTESDSEKSGEGTGSDSDSESEGVESLGGLGDKIREGKDETEAATKLLAAENLLHVCVSSNRNDAFLQQALLTLNDQQLLSLLHYLHHWLVRYWKEGDPRKISASLSSPSASSLSFPSSNHSTRLPTLGQVVDWTSLVLDAHFPSLIAFPNRYHRNRFGWLLKHIRRMIEDRHLHLCQHMETLKGFLDSWTKEKANDLERPAGDKQGQGKWKDHRISASAMSAEYSIELLWV